MMEDIISPFKLHLDELRRRLILCVVGIMIYLKVSSERGIVNSIAANFIFRDARQGMAVSYKRRLHI